MAVNYEFYEVPDHRYLSSEDIDAILKATGGVGYDLIDHVYIVRQRDFRRLLNNAIQLSQHYVHLEQIGEEIWPTVKDS
jgi:hypothetical protein